MIPELRRSKQLLDRVRRSAGIMKALESVKPAPTANFAAGSCLQAVQLKPTV
jgi:hypothetical protein